MAIFTSIATIILLPMQCNGTAAAAAAMATLNFDIC